MYTGEAMRGTTKSRFLVLTALTDNDHSRFMGIMSCWEEVYLPYQISIGGSVNPCRNPIISRCTPIFSIIFHNERSASSRSLYPSNITGGSLPTCKSFEVADRSAGKESVL